MKKNFFRSNLNVPFANRKELSDRDIIKKGHFYFIYTFKYFDFSINNYFAAYLYLYEPLEFFFI